MLRVGNMRGVDLSIFDVDYDMPWNAIFLTADGQALGRFGGRDVDTPAKYQSLAGLRHSLAENLKRFRAQANKKPTPRMPMFAEDYPAADRRAENACIHCHHVYEYRRDYLQSKGQWSLDEVWVYPMPENLGLTLDINQGNRVVAVQPKSAAATLGVRAKDQLVCINGMPIASVADLQYALHKAPKQGALAVVWNDDTRERTGVIPLPDNWKQTDVSWRWSIKSMSPSPGIIGEDLDGEERKLLGLDPRQLAYRQMNFLPAAARHAGLRANDVIVGIDGQKLTMNARQFETHIRLHYRTGQEITLQVLRGKQPVSLPLKLPE